MKIETADAWTGPWADSTRALFIVLGSGGRQADIFAAAERQAQRQDARGALWVPDIKAVPNSMLNLPNAGSGVVAYTTCLNRHIVGTFQDADLPGNVLDTRVDDAFSNAGLHC